MGGGMVGFGYEGSSETGIGVRMFIPIGCRDGLSEHDSRTRTAHQNFDAALVPKQDFAKDQHENIERNNRKRYQARNSIRPGWHR